MSAEAPKRAPPADAPARASAEPRASSPARYLWGFWLCVAAGGALFTWHQLRGGGAARRGEVRDREPVTEASLAAHAKRRGALAAGKALFIDRCAQCHGDRGQGSVGPNLTDRYFLHGRGTLSDLYEIVSEGAPARGMPAWGGELTPAELRDVVAFVGSLRFTNVPGKAPQGTAPAVSGAPPL